MATTFNVRVYQIEKRKNAKGKVTSYRVIWYVAGRRFTESFSKSALANGFRSQLNVSLTKGEPFEVETGKPTAWAREEKRRRAEQERQRQRQTTWYSAARAFADEKWDESWGKHRAGIAYLLSLATFAMLPEPDRRPFSEKEIRTALRRWGFNKGRRNEVPHEQAEILAWVEAECRPACDLERSSTAKALLNAANTTCAGKTAAPSTRRRHQIILGSVLKYMVKEGLLEANPFEVHGFSTPSRRTVVSRVDRRCVVNPSQATRLLDAVEKRKPSGPLLMPFFASMYYSGLRPEEAVTVRWKHELVLPDTDDEWGEWVLSKAAPEVGREWTDSGESRDSGPLKHREEGTYRYAPIPPGGGRDPAQAQGGTRRRSRRAGVLRRSGQDALRSDHHADLGSGPQGRTDG